MFGYFRDTNHKMDTNFIITGAAMGFGREFSRRVLEAGGRVVAADKNITAGEVSGDNQSEDFIYSFSQSEAFI